MREKMRNSPNNIKCIFYIIKNYRINNEYKLTNISIKIN
jgi:hypothetical protein